VTQIEDLNAFCVQLHGRCSIFNYAKKEESNIMKRLSILAILILAFAMTTAACDSDSTIDQAESAIEAEGDAIEADLESKGDAIEADLESKEDAIEAEVD
jgi:hypothetical protein